MKTCYRARQQGFSLLEILVAFSIMAMALGALYHAAATSTRSASIATNQTRATVAAESLLHRHRYAPRNGIHESGRFDAFEWFVRSERDARLFEEDTAVLQRIVVEVSWNEAGRERRVRLASLIPEER